MKCSKCGAELQEGLLFCIKCGEIKENRMENASQGRKNTSIWLILLAIAFLPITITYYVVKSNRLKKMVKAIIIVVVWGLTLLFGSMSDDENKVNEVDTKPIQEKSVDKQKKDVTDKEISIKSIKVAKKKRYELTIGKTKIIVFKIKPSGIDEDAFVVKNSNNKVVSTEIKSIKDGKDSTIVTLQANALVGGKTKICLKSKDGKIVSKKVLIKVSKVEQIGGFNTQYRSMEVGDRINYTCYLRPKKLGKKDVRVVVKKKNVLRVSNVKFKSKDGLTVLKFTISAINKGRTKLFIQSKVGKMSSDKVLISVKEKDTSPIVYVTPYGERYHYSRACAGDNAIQTTLNSTYHEPCSKCAR